MMLNSLLLNLILSLTINYLLGYFYERHGFYNGYQGRHRGQTKTAATAWRRVLAGIHRWDALRAGCDR